MNTNAGVTNLYGSFTAGTETINANATLNVFADQTIGALNVADGVEVTFGDGLPFAPEPGKGGGFSAPFTASVGGTSLASGPSSAVVPEPGSVGLLLVGSIGFLARRRRQK